MAKGMEQKRLTRRTPVGVIDQRHAGARGTHGRHDVLRIRQAELGVLVRRQVVRPRVEQLHHLHPRRPRVSTRCPARQQAPRAHRADVGAAWRRCPHVFRAACMRMASAEHAASQASISHSRLCTDPKSCREHRRGEHGEHMCSPPCPAATSSCPPRIMPGCSPALLSAFRTYPPAHTCAVEGARTGATSVLLRGRACAPASIWWQTYTTSASARCASSACSTSGAPVMMRCRPPHTPASGTGALRLRDALCWPHQTAGVPCAPGRCRCCLAALFADDQALEAPRLHGSANSGAHARGRSAGSDAPPPGAPPASGRTGCTNFGAVAGAHRGASPSRRARAP